MSEFQKYILASTHMSAPVVSLFCSRILIRYLKSKSLGMQTLLDKFMIELQYVFIFMSFAMSYPMATGNLFSNNLTEPVRYILIGFFLVSSYLFFLHLVAYLVIRYLSIYHSTVLQYQIDESRLIVRVRFGLLVVAVLLSGIEFIDNGVHQLNPYQVLVYGIAQPDGTVATNFQILASVTLLLLIMLQSRIEYDNFVFIEATETYQMEEGLNIVVQQYSSPQRKVKLNRVRFGVVVGTIAFLVSMVLLPKTRTSNQKVIGVCVSLLFVHCIIPIMYILSYPNLKSFTISQVKSIFLRN
jgi:hypothetical protein